MSRPKEKRTITVELTEYDDGHWSATYRSETMTGTVGGNTAGEAAQTLVDSYEGVEAKAKDLLAAMEQGSLPSAVEFLRRAGLVDADCTCGKCPVPSTEDEDDKDSLLN